MSSSVLTVAARCAYTQCLYFLSLCKKHRASSVLGVIFPPLRFEYTAPAFENALSEADEATGQQKIQHAK